MFDTKPYIEQLNKIELELLNNYLIENNFEEQELQYRLITIDKNKNLRFQSYLCLIKSVFKYFINRYVDTCCQDFLTKNIEIFNKYTNDYNFSINISSIENIFHTLSQLEILHVLESFHNNYLNTEIVIKNQFVKI